MRYLPKLIGVHAKEIIDQNSFGNIKILSQIYMYDQDVTVT